jgi:hypothetical protein
MFLSPRSLDLDTMGFRLSLWFVMMDVFASDFKFDVMIGH